MNEPRRRSLATSVAQRGPKVWLFLAALLVLATSGGLLSAQPATTARATAAPSVRASATAAPSARPSTSAPPAASASSPTPPLGATSAPSASASASADVVEEPPVAVVGPARPMVTATAEPSVTPEPSASAPPPPPPTPTVEPTPVPVAATPHEVKLLDQVVFVVRTDSGDVSSERRAKDAARALKESSADATPDDVHVEILARDGEDIAVVYVKKTPIVQLTQADARAAQDASLAVHADSVVSAIKNALRKEKDRSILASRVFSISLVVFFAVAMFYIVRKIADFAERANAFLDAHPERVPALRIRRMEVINSAALRSGLVLALNLGKWVAQIGIVYLWLVAVLSLFDATRGYTERLTGFILEPFAAIATRLAASFPILLLVGIALIAIAILLRVIGVFFQGVAEGTTTLSWLPAELARPTSVLIRGAVIVFFLVFVAPLLSGNAEGALARAGWIALLAVGVSAVPLLASTVVGATVLFGRRAEPGEFVEVGDQAGRVVEVTLVDVVLEDESGVEVHVPHFAWLTRPVRCLGAAPRVSVRATVQRTELDAATTARLLAAAGALGADPRVDVEEIGATTVRFAVSVVSDELGTRGRLTSTVWATLSGEANASSTEAPG